MAAGRVVWVLTHQPLVLKQQGQFMMKHYRLTQDVTCRSIRSSNIPQGNPGAFELLKIVRSNARPTGPKLCLNALPKSGI